MGDKSIKSQTGSEIKVEFRGYTDSDYAELSEMIFALYQEDNYGQPMNPSKIERTVSELTIDPGRGKILLFIADRSIAGYAILINYWSNEYGGELIIIDELYVKKHRRNRGVGSMFIRYLRENRTEKVEGIQLEASLLNKNAISFYENSGFICSENRLFIKLFQNDPAL